MSPNQAKDITSREEARDVLRVEELKKLVNEWNIKIAKCEADFQNMLIGQRARWANEELEHNEHKKELQKEIEELEVKKLNVLIPINILGESAEGRLEESVKFLAELHKRESDVEEMTELLEDKLDAVGERELIVANKTRQQQLAKEGIERQQENIKLQSEKLTQEMIDFAIKKSKEEKEIRDAQTTNILREQSLLSKEESIKATEKSLSEWAVRLQDERRLLDSAWQELERKKISP